MKTHFTPKAVIDELMRQPVRKSVDDARVFDPASGLHPAWGSVGKASCDAAEEERSDG